MSTQHERVAEQIAAIETEMERIGLWQAEPIAPDLLKSLGAFGMNTLTFPQWLQFILVPTSTRSLPKRAGFPKEATSASRRFEISTAWMRPIVSSNSWASSIG
jgi:uncharacterized protein YqcC (DUF446 family)